MSVAGWQYLCYSAIDTRGFASSPEKDSPPAFEMVCLGILVNTKDFTLRVPESRLRELSDELHLWLSRERFTVKELQSLLGELSFVTSCVHASRIFLPRLLNALRSFPSNAKSQLVTLEMRHDLAWWQTFLPIYNGISVIKPADWSFADFRFISRTLVWLAAEPRASKILYIPFPGFFPPRLVSHLCSGTLHCYCRGKVLAHSIATSAISRLLRQWGGGYRDQFGLHQGSFHVALFAPVVVHFSASWCWPPRLAFFSLSITH